MTYLKSKDTTEPYLPYIWVYENGEFGIEGFYHCQDLRIPPHRKFVHDQKCIPNWLLDSAWYRAGLYELGIMMQGGCHRDIFREFVLHFQSIYQELWCWTSIKSVGRTDTYGQLGFSFNPVVQYTFPNPHKNGEESTYQLGRWTRR